MRITKRNGSEEDFDQEKVITAITKANDATEGNRLSKEQICDIADFSNLFCWGIYCKKGVKVKWKEMCIQIMRLLLM